GLPLQEQPVELDLGLEVRPFQEQLDATKIELVQLQAAQGREGAVSGSDGEVKLGQIVGILALQAVEDPQRVRLPPHQDVQANEIALHSPGELVFPDRLLDVALP